MSERFKPTLCIDFDGVIHDYRDGWKNGVIYGEIVPGFLAWAIEAAQHFTLVVYSSRSATQPGELAMKYWLRHKLAERLMPAEIDTFLALFEFSDKKPPAFLTIDDRAICFKGDWSAPELTPAALAAFKPWTTA